MRAYSSTPSRNLAVGAALVAGAIAVFSYTTFQDIIHQRISGKAYEGSGGNLCLEYKGEKYVLDLDRPKMGGGIDDLLHDNKQKIDERSRNALKLANFGEIYIGSQKIGLWRYLTNNNLRGEKFSITLDPDKVRIIRFDRDYLIPKKDTSGLCGF